MLKVTVWLLGIRYSLLCLQYQSTFSLISELTIFSVHAFFWLYMSHVPYPPKSAFHPWNPSNPLSKLHLYICSFSSIVLLLLLQFVSWSLSIIILFNILCLFWALSYPKKILEYFFLSLPFSLSFCIYILSFRCYSSLLLHPPLTLLLC